MSRRSSPPPKGTYENPLPLSSIDLIRPVNWYILTRPQIYYKKVRTETGGQTIIWGEVGRGTKLFFGLDGKCRISRFTPTFTYSRFKTFQSNWNKHYRYKIGKEARIHRIFKGKNTCAHGIHGFLTWDQANIFRF